MKRLLLLLFFIPFISLAQVPQGVGAEVMREDLQQFAGEYVKSINLKEYNRGIYFLEIETNGGVINKKLILQ